MAATVAALVSALALDEVAPDSFAGRSPTTGWSRVFGGLILAQALVAAARTASGRTAHALHGSFLLPGDPDEPFVYAVERMRDGGSFTSRRCVASQHGRPIFALTASFQAPEASPLEHAAAMPSVPPPEALAAAADLAGAPAALRGFTRRHAAVEIRPVDAGDHARDRAERGRASQAVWLRAAGVLPDDPVLHAAVLAYMSDVTLLDTALVPFGRSAFDDDVQAASLDHALWLHRPVRADDWLLYAQEAPSAGGGRGFARGALFSRGGRLVASTAQEGLLRDRAGARPERPPSAS